MFQILGWDVICPRLVRELNEILLDSSEDEKGSYKSLRLTFMPFWAPSLKWGFNLWRLIKITGVQHQVE